MKTYPKNKFLELTLERRVRVLLDGIYELEENWSDSEHRASLLPQLREYFQWMNFFEMDQPLLKRVASFDKKLEGEITLRQWLDVAVPFERFLNLSVKEEHLVPVREGDRVERTRETLPLYFVLDHLRSAFNVGSLFRTAECLGVQKIYLVGYTPTPEDSGVQKTAMGTEQTVAWETFHHLEEVAAELTKMAVPLVALETGETAQSLVEWQASGAVAWVVGNERFGLNQKELQLVDQVVEIPMLGQKNSLNVANALTIAAYETVRQWKK